MKIKLWVAVVIAIVAYGMGHTIGEGDGYCHAKFSKNPAVCDVP